MLHGARLPATIDAIEHASDDFLLPLVGCTLRSALAVPEPVEGVSLEGVGLAFSSLKESEDGEWLALRCVNLREEEVQGAWTVPFTISSVRLARLDETAIEEVSNSGRRIEFRAAPRAIVTLLVR